MSEIAKVPGVVGARPMALVPTSFDEIWRMGNMLSQTQMVPDAFRGKPNDCTAAIMAGMEVGLSPMAALQSIAVINGRPALWGDGLMAVVRASGLLEWIKEEDDGDTAICTVKRRGEPEPVTRAFSQAQAVLAQLAGKGTWKSYPARMRAMRARSWALRDTFADVLKGIASAEEMQDVAMRDVTPRASVSSLPGPAPINMAPVSPGEDLDVEPDTDTSGFDVDGLLDRLKHALDKCASSNELVAAWRPFDAEIEGPMPLDQRPRAYALYDEAEARIEGTA